MIRRALQSAEGLIEAARDDMDDNPADAAIDLESAIDELKNAVEALWEREEG